MRNYSPDIVHSAAICNAVNRPEVVVSHCCKRLFAEIGKTTFSGRRKVSRMADFFINFWKKVAAYHPTITVPSNEV